MEITHTVLPCSFVFLVKVFFCIYIYIFFLASHVVTSLSSQPKWANEIKIYESHLKTLCSLFLFNELPMIGSDSQPEGLILSSGCCLEFHMFSLCACGFQPQSENIQVGGLTTLYCSWVSMYVCRKYRTFSLTFNACRTKKGH